MTTQPQPKPVSKQDADKVKALIAKLGGKVPPAK